jgi:hypothetical protein
MRNANRDWASGSPVRWIEKFKEDLDSVLFGTDSF